MKSSLRPTIVVEGEGDEDRDRSKCSAGLRSKALMFSALVQQSLHWLPHDASSNVSSKRSNENHRSTWRYFYILCVMTYDNVSVEPHQVALKNKRGEQDPSTDNDN